MKSYSVLSLRVLSSHATQEAADMLFDIYSTSPSNGIVFIGLYDTETNNFEILRRDIGGSKEMGL